jgi:acyl-CoA synthetase (AMP-forming)/AMP-acid ligase II
MDGTRQDATDGPTLLRRWIDAAASRHADKPFAVSVADGRALSYGELQRRAGGIAAFLAARGIGANGRVALLANNSLEHLAAYVGVIAAGATVCTVHVEMNRAHIDVILPKLAPRLALFEPGLGLEALADASAPLALPLDRFCAEVASSAPDRPTSSAPTDDAVIYFTSGTSAHPKGVVLTYRELLPNAAAIADAFGIDASDRLYDYRSFNWASAQILSALAILSKGATLLLGRKFSKRGFFADIAAHRATIAAANPTVLHMLLQDPEPIHCRDLPHLRFITSSSAPLLLEEWKRFEARFGIPVAQGYGSSETGWIAGGTDATRRHGSVGRPLAYLRLAIVDNAGRSLPPRAIGHVELGGIEGNAFRYLDEAGSIRINAIGRVRTGDMGFLDEDGYLHLTGREKDLIIRGGVNISPLEIDAVLMQMPGIAEAATIGVPDPVYGEEVVSVVVLQPGAALAAGDILAFCASRLAAFKAPKQIEFRASLPKTERGKLDRKALVAERLAANLPTRPDPP